MECPIKNHAVETGTYRGKSSTRDCIKAECAWWFKEHNCCSLTAVANMLYNEFILIDRGSFAKYVEEEKSG